MSVRLSTSTVARKLGISAQWVRKLAKRRGLGVRIEGRVLFTPEEVDAMRDRPGPGNPTGANGRTPHGA